MTPAKSCGGCTLCCTLVPVELGGAQKTRVHAVPASARPVPRRRARLRHLPDAPAPLPRLELRLADQSRSSPELRPDRCGVVIDPVVDLIKVNGDEQPAAQLWVAPGHEMAFEKEIVAAMILGLLKQVPFVLWRQRGADGAQWARAICRTGDGVLGVSPLTKSAYNLGTELERWARVDQLMGKGTGNRHGNVPKRGIAQ